MDKLTVYKGIAVPLKRSNVDTDQIIPAAYLRRVSRAEGFSDALFEAWRANEPDFVLNLPQYANASILVAGPEFGTGSSREHAVWALADYGFRVVISSRFADIFRNNSGKQGLLTAEVGQEDVEAIWDYIDTNQQAQLTVDLEQRKVFCGETSYSFEVDDYTRYRLLNGLDDIDITLLNNELIANFETTRPSYKPKTLPVRTFPSAEIVSAHYDTRSPIDPAVGV
jgi:3-isopropylmalate/(R)-2-methylmalate dehydratase small subunit